MNFNWSCDIRIGKHESFHHDLVRLFLVLQVIIGHVAALTLPQMPALLSDPFGNGFEVLLKSLTRFGPQAAYLFVFLSGYMVAGQLLHSFRTRHQISLQTFLLRRLTKLLPGVFIALSLTAILDGIAIFVLGRSAFYESILGVNAVRNYRLDLFVANLLFLEPTFTPSFGSNGPLWTLGYIFQYYLAGFGVLLITRLNPWLGASCGALLIVVVSFVRLEWSILFLVWLAGGWCRNLRVTGVSPPLMLIGLAVGLFFISNLLPPLFSAAVSVFVGFPLALCLRSECSLHLKNVAPLIRSMADHTYVAYAAHFPMLVFAASFVVGGISPLAAYALVATSTFVGIFLITKLGRLGTLCKAHLMEHK